MDLEELPHPISSIPPDGGSNEQRLHHQNPSRSHQVYQKMAEFVQVLYTGFNVPFRGFEAPLPLTLPGIGQNVNDYSCRVVQKTPLECLAMLMDPGFVPCNQFPQETPSLLTAARESISQVTNSSKPPSAKLILSKSLRQKHNEYWNASLDHLQVQSKFKDTVALEPGIN